MRACGQDFRLCCEDGAGSTGETFQAILSYVSKFRPPLGLFENVPSINAKCDEDELTDSNLDIVVPRSHIAATQHFSRDPCWTLLGTLICQVRAFQQVGYITYATQMSPLDYGAAQSRLRIYILVIKAEMVVPGVLDVPRSMATCLGSLHLPRRAVQDYIFHNDDPRVATWMRAPSKPAAGGKWQKLHAKLFAQAGLPWPGRVAVQQLPRLAAYFADAHMAPLSEREVDALVFLVATFEGCPPGYPKDEALADLIHSLDRIKHFRFGCSPCVLPHSKLWAFGSKRILTPEECFGLQDFHLQNSSICVEPLPSGQRTKRKLPLTAISHQWSARVLQDLAGNAFQASCAAAACVTLLAHARPL